MSASGQALKRAGMVAASSAAGPWNDEADQAILELARSGEEFTADQLIERVGMPEHRNAVGARLSAAARRGWIQRTGDRQADNRAEQHARRVSLWIGAGGAQTAVVGPPARQAPPRVHPPIKSAFETMPLYQCHYCHEYLSADQLGHEPGPPGSGIIWRVHRPPCFSEEVPA